MYRNVSMIEVDMKDKLLQIEKDAYRFFRDFTSFNQLNHTYGLTLDHTEKDIYTIAAVGYFLPSLIIGAERGYISKEEALEKTINTLKNLQNIEHKNGLFVHFVDKNGHRYQKTEYSTIDTWIAFMGMLAVDSYFKNQEVSALVMYFINRFDFKWLIFEQDNKKYFRMSYNPDKDGSYVEGEPGFIYRWHMLSEALFIYILFAGINDDNEESLQLYEGFDRTLKTYKSNSFYHTPGNTLFVYQLPLGFINFKNYTDQNDINWYDNGVKAIRANYQSSIENHRDPILKDYGWGATASDSPFGYRVYGPIPAATHLNYPDGTYSPSAIISSIPFLEEISVNTLKEFDKYPVSGKYGYYDSFNLRENWVSSRYYGFNKGMELIFSNLKIDGLIQTLITEHPIIQQGFKNLKFRRV